MKKFTAVVLILSALVLLIGCQKKDSVLKAWSGEYSKEEKISAINEYRENYANIVLKKGGASSVSFETDFEVSSCSVPLLSRVDDTNIEVELNGYIDTYIETSSEGRTVTIPVDWWYATTDSWVNDYLIWSYLVSVKDINGGTHYYYFRVDYSAYAQ